MPAPLIDVRHLESPAPEPGPLLPFASDGDHVILGIGGLGSVRVDHAGITVSGPDEPAREAVWARLGAWASGQWYAAQGLAVVNATVVARDDRCLCLFAQSQQGATSTAACLTTLGWSIVSDDIAIIDHAGVALSTGGRVTVDTLIAEVLFTDRPQRPLPTGRPRSHLDLPGHADATITDFVSIRIVNAAEDIVILDPTQAPQDTARPRLVPAYLRAVTEPATVPVVPAWVAARITPLSEEMLWRVHPPAMARALDAALVGFDVSRKAST